MSKSENHFAPRGCISGGPFSVPGLYLWGDNCVSGVKIGFPMYSYGFPVVFPRNSYGFHMVLPCCFWGVSLWISHGLHAHSYSFLWFYNPEVNAGIVCIVLICFHTTYIVVSSPCVIFYIPSHHTKIYEHNCLVF